MSRLIRGITALGAGILMLLGALTGITTAQAQAPAEDRLPAASPEDAVTVAGAALGAARGAARGAPHRAAVTAKARRYYWGAISIANGDYASGVSYDWPRKRGARKRALRICRAKSRYPRSCQVNLVIVNQCGAYAWKRRPNGNLRWGWGRARYRGNAIRRARRKAGGPRGAKLLTWVCTTRP